MSNYYCGINKVPKGKKRGTPKYCYTNKQVRYYGLEALDQDILEELEKAAKKGSLQKEQINLKNLEFKGTKLLKEIKNVKVAIEVAEDNDKSTKQLDKKLAKLYATRDKFVKQYKKQQEYVKQLEKEEKKEREKAKKKKKKK